MPHRPASTAIAWRAPYNWESYAARGALLTLSSVYRCTFALCLKRVSNLDRTETKRYLEALYVLTLRPLIKKVPLQADAEEGGAVDLTSPQPKRSACFVPVA
ncbi:hypothetical protein Rsub_11684 [Raphidocelis subcapitata]|uniref:Uncharacterized protein n=1 Tax=Raphidocelis subcapitata TaxID=307507 RepID=A0A2V0PF60_9CHLO|nr:hypothetical protein Rsub_11684 [Raphidocelis subcapitata]|eukprot:GBF98474.1 hypothetical protein Rsub_11684 [Raphidocelis subcapitata]